MLRNSLPWVATVAAALATACSPYDYSDEVKAISAGVDQLSVSIAGAYSGLESDRNAQRQRLMIENRAQLVLPDRCNRMLKPLPKPNQSQEKKDGEAEPPEPVLTPAQKAARAPCVVERRQPSDHSPPPIQPDPNAPPPPAAEEEARKNVLKAAAILKGYANGLAAVTNAKDRAEYEASVAKLSSAVQEMAKFADPFVPGISAVAPAVVNVFGWLVGVALDQQRYATLKEVVNRVNTPLKQDDPTTRPIAVVTDTIGLAYEDVTGERLRVLNKEADILVYPLGRTITTEAAYRRRLTEVNALTDSIEALRKSGYAGNGLADAHAKLVKAVNEGGVNIADLQKAVEEFVKQVSALKEAIDASAKPAAKKGE